MGSSSFRFIPAEPQHNDVLKKLYSSVSYDGPLDIQFRRGDSPYESISGEGIDSVILLGQNTETGEFSGMGACCIHEMYVDGEIKRVGYLNGLKVSPESKRQAILIPKAFEAMHKQLEGRVDLCFAAILNSPPEIQKMFEKRSKIMPKYVRQCGYASFCFAPARRDRLKLVRGNIDGLDDFYAENGIKYNLFPLRKARGVSDENRLSWIRDGMIVASCAVFDDMKNKNYYLNSCRGIFKILSRLPTQLFGLPKFPEEHSPVSCATVSMLLFDKALSLRDRARFIRAASSYAKGYGMCALTVTDTDDSYNAVKRIPHISIPGRIYTVDWGDEHDLSARPVYADAALM